MAEAPSLQRKIAILRRLLRAKDVMDVASHRPLSIDDLASISGVSKAHFAREFLKAFGTPPHRYLLSRRIERAIALLRETDLPVTLVALDTGWSSLGTFGRTFRDITGLSPSAMRQRLRMVPQESADVPYCYIRAAARPQLNRAVSEKRPSRVNDMPGAVHKEHTNP